MYMIITSIKNMYWYMITYKIYKLTILDWHTSNNFSLYQYTFKNKIVE